MKNISDNRYLPPICISKISNSLLKKEGFYLAKCDVHDSIRKKRININNQQKGGPGVLKPLESRGARNEMSKRFFHKFLLNDTFAPAERFNSELGIGHYWPDVPRDWQELSASVDGLANI